MAVPRVIRISLDNGLSFNIRLLNLEGMTGSWAEQSFVTGLSGILRSAITNAVAGVNTINGLSGTILLSGSGNTTVHNSGNTFYISSSGGGDVTSATLASTGSTLDNKINSLSGYSNTSFATISNLTATGANLQGQVSSLITNLYSTGSSLDGRIAGLSGTLVGTGALLQNQITFLNSSLTGYSITGSNNLGGVLSIYDGGNVTASLSGSRLYISGNTGAYSTFATAANLTTTNSNLVATGATLHSEIEGLSGKLVESGVLITYLSSVTGSFQYSGVLNERLTATGQTLLALIQASSAGVSSLNSRSGAMVISGAGNLQVVNSGVNTIYVSGVDLATTTNLTNTGVTLHNEIVGLSGKLVESGVLITYINSVTGSFGFSGVLSDRLTATGVNLQNQVNYLNSSLTGYSVTGSNNLGGVLTIFDGGNVTTTFSGSRLYISGNTGAYATFASAANLTTTNTNLTNTGVTLHSEVVGLSGTLIGTGALITYINSVTGSFQYSGVLSDRLTATGATLLSQIQASSAGVTNLNSRSGIMVISGAGNVQVVNSGTNTIYVSGNFVTVTTGTVSIQGGANIRDGQILIGNSGLNSFDQGGLDGLSGIVIQSGSGTLKVSFDTGSLTTWYATVGNLFSTGSNLATRIDSISGFTYSQLTGYSITGSTNAGGLLIIYDGGNVTTSLSGARLYISGNTGAYSTFATVANLQSTGSNLQTQINTINATSGGFASVRVTGSSNLVIANLSGAGLIDVGYNGTWTIVSGHPAVVTGIVAGSGVTAVNNGDRTYTINAITITGTNEIWISAGAMTPAIVSGATTGTIMTAQSGLSYDVLEFDNLNSQFAYFNLSFPMAWNNSAVKAKFYWTATGTPGSATGIVCWVLAGATIKDNNPLDIYFNSGASVLDTYFSGNYLHQTTGTDFITISGSPVNADMCFFKVYRDAGGSTFGGKSRLLGLSLMYGFSGVNKTLY